MSADSALTEGSLSLTNIYIQIRYIQGVRGGICHILGFDRGHLKMQENWFYTFFLGIVVGLYGFVLQTILLFKITNLRALKLHTHIFM